MNKGVLSGKMRRNLHFSLLFIYLFIWRMQHSDRYNILDR